MMKVKLGNFHIGTMRVRKPTARNDLWIVETWLVVAWKKKEKRFAKRVMKLRTQIKHQTAIIIYEN